MGKKKKKRFKIGRFKDLKLLLNKKRNNVLITVLKAAGSKLPYVAGKQKRKQHSARTYPPSRNNVSL